ncbi:MAG: hypothetical protein ACTHNT_08620 [Actinomycetales bacterium]
MSDSTTSPTTTTTPGVTSTPGSSAPDGTAGGAATATASAAKEHGAAVAQTAKGDAQQVAGTAMDQAKQVMQESTDQARHLLDEAKSQGQEQAMQQKQRAADGLRSVAQELQTMAGHSGQQGIATNAARQAGQRLDHAARWLEQHEPQDLVEEVRGFARRKPGTFLLGAALAGVVAGRLFRGTKDASSSGVTAAGNPNDSRLPVTTGTTGTPGYGSAGYATPGYGTDELPRTEPGTDDLVVDLTDERSTAVPPLTEPGLTPAGMTDPLVEEPVGDRPRGERGLGGTPL